MKITFFIQDFSDGGAQHMIVNMANAFAARGHAVDIAVVSDNGPHKEKLSGGVQVTNLNKNRSLAAVFALVKHLQEKKPDILLSALTHANLVAVMAKLLVRGSKTKVILTERTFLSLHIKNSRRLFDKISLFGVKIFYRFADKIIGISKGVQDDVQRIVHLKDSQVGYIYNPVVTKEMLSACDTEDTISLTDNSDQKVFITSGRLAPEKDYATLLQAFAKLRQDHDVKLVFLGDGPLRGDLERQAKDLSIQDSVCFQGFVSNALAYMKGADIFVMTSLYEGFCNVIVEALLCGMPVVSTDAPSGPREILDGGQYGHLAPVGDANALANAMAQAIQEKSNPKKQKERALCFTVEAICDEFESLFDNARGKSL